ncbi:hypothetical protein [Proteus terrae]|uniref:hypothetical protein n=1 Tax=Proteus terrae TaxID=1574161 RepID=UPI000ABE194B|nr:hypothetical protein [Proteus terrae]
MLDSKVQQGHSYAFMNGDGSIDNRKYTTAIKGNQPREAHSLITPLAEKLPDIPLKNAHEYRRYLG